MSSYGAIENCQVCNAGNQQSVLFLGYLPPVNTMRAVGSIPHEESAFPAEMRYCPKCHLVQLGYAVDPHVLFPPDYPYTSGSTRILRENFAELQRDVQQRVGLTADDLVVDIGSNDGTLLSNFANAGNRVAGIEPSLTAQIGEARGIPTLMAFFDEKAVDFVLEQHGRPRIVTATNVFAHIHHVDALVENVGRLIGETGIFISESHYLLDLIETLQYDTIYHEHLRYYSLTSLKYLLEMHGLRVIHAKRIGTHGGSIRVYATKDPSVPEDASVAAILQTEAAAGLVSGSWIPEFRRRVLQSKLDLYALLAGIKQKGASIFGVGAPSRASTLINYVGLDDGILDCVVEVKTSKKLNKYVPGTLIPVVDEARLYAEQPEYALLLSWHIASELMENLRRNGFKGEFLTPLPVPQVLKG
jgi:SAM-dependent methyltransferase